MATGVHSFIREIPEVNIMKSFLKLAIDATLLGTVALALLLPRFRAAGDRSHLVRPVGESRPLMSRKLPQLTSGKPRKIKMASQDRPKNKKVVDGKVLQPEATERAALVRK